MSWKEELCKCKQNGILHMEISDIDYENLSEDQKNNGTIYFVYSTDENGEKTGSGEIFRYNINFVSPPLPEPQEEIYDAGMKDHDNNDNGEIFNSYEGAQKNIASGTNSHAEGFNTVASGNCSHAEGEYCVAAGIASHAEGHSTSINHGSIGDFSHVEGYNTAAIGRGAHAEGISTIAGPTIYTPETSEYDQENYKGSHAEGYSTSATSPYAHAEGNATVANGNSSHSEGYNTSSNGTASHSEGHGSIAGAESRPSYLTNDTFGDTSHAEGYQTNAITNYSHTEGFQTYTGSNIDAAYYQSKEYSENQGHIGYAAHAEGENTVANGRAAHSSGQNTYATGDGSYSGGYAKDNTATYAVIAKGKGSIAQGISVQANNQAEAAFGSFNNSRTENGRATVFSVGNGHDATGSLPLVRSNAIEVFQNGNTNISGQYKDKTGLVLIPVVPIDISDQDFHYTDIAAFLASQDARPDVFYAFYDSSQNT